MKVEVAFLTRNDGVSAVQFLKKTNGFEAKIFADEKNFVFENQTSSLWDGRLKENTIYIDSEEAIKFGFINSMFSEGITHIQKQVTALDKALYYYCKLGSNCPDFVFLVEDDCFAPTAEAFENLVAMAKNPNTKSDLIIRSHIKKTNNIPDWHWRNVFQLLEPPYFHSMANVVGLSKRLLGTIANFASKHGTLFYHEIMFNTLAAQNGFYIYCPEEFKTVVWQGEWGIDDFLIKPTNFFHPVKGGKRQVEIKHILEACKKLNYKPANKLPKFVTFSEEELEGAEG